MTRRTLTTFNPKPASVALKEDKVTPITDFLKENYKIMVNRLDSNQIIIQSINKKYQFEPNLNDISLHLMEEGVSHSDSLLRKIMQSPNRMESFDPIADYFENIKGKYEGKSQIDLLCEHLTPTNYGDKDDNYYKERANKLLRKWIVATAACAINNDPNDVVLGFVQEKEGTGKTFLSKFLVPDDLKEYITQSYTDKRKFTIAESFTNSFVVLFDECVGLNNRTAEEFKSTVSSDQLKVIDKRYPFPITMSRVGSGILTSNNKTGKHRGFLTPALGYRRFGIIALDNINYEYSKKVIVDQIWAEACMLIEQNFDYKFNQTDFEEFYEYNQRFKIETSALIVVKQNYELPTNGEGCWLMASEILQDLRKNRKINGDAAKEVTPEGIGEALNQLGFTRKSKKKDGMARYRYYVKNL